MIKTVLWTITGALTGYTLMNFFDFFYYKLYKKNISKSYKYDIITSITFLAFLRGCTGNDLITNIKKLIF